MEGKEIDNLNLCYQYLCSNPLDDIEKIRQMYSFYQSYAIEYPGVICSREYNDNEDFFEFKKEQEREFRKLYTMIRLMHDSYLAILLSRNYPNSYKSIIKGLCSYFECSDSKIGAPLEIEKYETKEILITKEEYIKNLKITQHSSTHAGDYLITPSLGSIIEIEKEMLKPDEFVKCLQLKQEIEYGDLK